MEPLYHMEDDESQNNNITVQAKAIKEALKEAGADVK